MINQQHLEALDNLVTELLAVVQSGNVRLELQHIRTAVEGLSWEGRTLRQAALDYDVMPF